MTDNREPAVYPKQMFHASMDPIIVYNKQQEAELGPDWSEKYIYGRYPTWKYHWTKPAEIVNNADEDAALGSGWTKNPTAFDPYKGARRAGSDQADPVKWVDEWPVPGLSFEDRNKIRAQLWKADGEFWKSPDAPAANVDSMKLAFVGISKVLFQAGILTEQLLQNEIPLLVWDSAIAGGWWRFASEIRQDIFPEQLGHYFVWRDDSKDWQELFRSETSEQRSMLSEVSAQPQAPPARDHAASPALGPGSPTQVEVAPAPEQNGRAALAATASEPRLNGVSQREPAAEVRPRQRGARRRTPDLQSSRERLDLVNTLARELATIKPELKGYCTAENLKRRHPEFILWEHIDEAELRELVDGVEFTPRAFAENLTLRKFGITSRETLKKDRKKIRKAQQAKRP